MELTLAERVLLLALDDKKGSTGWTQIDPGLAGALLMDLGRLGVLRLDGKHLVPAGHTRPDHPVLAMTLDAIRGSARAHRAKTWVGRLLPKQLKPITETVAEPVVSRGVLTEQRSKMLGLFESVRFPETDAEPERALRADLRRVLLGERAPTDDDAMLFAALVPLDLVTGIVEREHRRGAKKRAKAIADGGVAGDALSAVIRDIQTTTYATITAAALAGTTASN